MKIATIIGARPQFIKAALISEKFKINKNFNEVIVHTGQHFSRNMSEVFNQMKIPKPIYNLSVNQMEYSQMIDTMFSRIDPVLKYEKPDAVIVYGDTNSTLAGALAASKYEIPIFHIESGLRSNNLLMKEEINRKITDHISTLLFCPTLSACNNLRKEKVNKKIIFSGDVMYDAYIKFEKKAISKLKIEKNKFVLATIHRRENINSKNNLLTIFSELDKINDEIEVIMPLHPHTKKKMQEIEINTKVRLLDPVGYFEMLYFLKNCSIVITDSGGLQKESYFAKKEMFGST